MQAHFGKLAAKCSEAWQGMTDDQKKPWREKAREENENRNEEIKVADVSRKRKVLYETKLTWILIVIH